MGIAGGMVAVSLASLLGSRSIPAPRHPGGPPCSPLAASGPAALSLTDSTLHMLLQSPGRKVRGLTPLAGRLIEAGVAR